VVFCVKELCKLIQLIADWRVRGLYRNYFHQSRIMV